ncbi:MAG: ATPase, T2SS/T4P/T4SS family [Victivallales bacterium]
MMDTKNMEAHKIADMILAEAVSIAASDIYILPAEHSCAVRARAGGRQVDICELPSDKGLQCISRIKVMAGLLTYRSQVSQDGVIVDESLFPGVEFRVSVMPSIFGERTTVRVLDKTRIPLYLEELNFTPEILAALKTMLSKNSGMIVLTGPTGCGKTTTIYAMIRELIRNNQDPSSIISIEDPVESIIEGITQVSLSKMSDEWNYERALRAALRQDVRTIVIGEMRDKDVVKVALDAALTGHRVITTFHAGDIPSVYARILHQGFEPFLAASAITGILSQRLVPSADGNSQIPLAALLEPDDGWRNFIIGNPGLAELRKKIYSYPRADLPQIAEKMAEQGIISKKDAYLI